MLFPIQILDLDAADAPIAGALLSSTGGPGPWSGLTDKCGYFMPNLTVPATYHVVVSKAGYTNESRDLGLGNPPDKPILIGLHRAAGVLPPIPSRAAVCALQTSLAGLTYNTVEFGPIPAWFYGKLTPADQATARATHLAAGDTHLPIPVSEAYREAGTLWPAALREGYDLAYDIPALRALLMPVLEAGLLVDMPLAGDGLSKSENPQQGEYNDPVGKMYGHEWLMRNFQRIALGLQGDGTPANPDLTPYIIFRPGWDGVFYGWGESASKNARLRWRHVDTRDAPMSKAALDAQQQRVKLFGELFRRVLPNGHLAIEHTPGTIPCGEGGGDYAPGGLMRTYDTILSEFGSVHEDSCWQVVGRMVSPYHRPPDQPAGDDPNPPFYLAPGTERGPYFYVGFEPTYGGVYEWCRGRCTVADVEQVRAYLRSLGCSYTG